MNGGAAPLRFLVAVVGGWVFLRAALLAPQWWTERNEATAASGTAVPAIPGPPAARDSPAPAAGVPTLPGGPVALWLKRPPAAATHAPERREAIATADAADRRTPLAAAQPIAVARPAPAPAPSPAVSPPPIAAAPAGTGRWSASAWLFLRRERGGGPALAPGGTLGGSQAGARLLYRLNADPARPLSAGLRLYAPLRRTAGAEIAAGIDWRPVARLPVNLLVERRQALGNEGRSAFSIAAYGGTSTRLPGGLRLDGYGQAGLVGLERRDFFVDGSLALVAPLGPVEIGAAAWGGAQPGVERLDVGPQLSLRLPARDARLRLSAEWRFRVAGDAAPGSGPALTLAAGF